MLRLIYVAVDLVLSAVGVFAFYVIRYNLSDAKNIASTLESWLRYHDVLTGLIVFPLMMVALYGLSGYYNDPRWRSRFNDFKNTAVIGFLGMLIIFFVILINDYLPVRALNYGLLSLLWLCLVIPVLIGRVIITTALHRRQKKMNGLYSAVIIGSRDRIKAVKKRLRDGRTGSVARHRIIGEIDDKIPFDSIIAEIERMAPDCIIVTSLPEGVEASTNLISRLYPLEKSILIPVDLYQLITTRTRMTDVVGEPLIDITGARVAASTANLKRIADIVGSTLALVVLAPLMAAIAVGVKLSSKGPVFYSQERVGLHKRPFKIKKFRTMYLDAEANGPALSTVDDPRVTPFGKTLRKYRLDELPQFWNVIRGEMSLVGPRPERPIYVERLSRRVPHYSLIHQVRPGITSWGMVKYGYASNIDEMVERLYYDLLYIENVSFSVDMKIIFHTVSTVVSGRGV